MNTRLIHIAAAALLTSILIRATVSIDTALAGGGALPDDAYYYMLVARNLAETGRSTFDGLTATNGYHPLWMGILSLAYRLGLGGATPENQIAGVLILQYAIAAVAAVVLWACVASIGKRDAREAALLLITAGLVWYPKHVSVSFSGMETALVVPLLFTVLFATARRPRLAGWIGLLLVLARLDTFVFVVLPAGLLHAWIHRTDRRRALSTLLRVSGPAMIAVFAYLAFNLVTFGHAKPISGAIKSCFPAVNFQLYQLFAPAERAIEGGRWALLFSFEPPGALAALCLVSLVLVFLGGRRRDSRNPVWPWIAIGFLQIFALVAFGKWAKPVPGWYYAAPIVITSAVVAGATLRLLGERSSMRIAVGLAAIAVLSPVRRLGPVLAGDARPRRPAHSPVVEFMRGTDADTVFCGTDVGGLAFWTGRRVMNLDGLINGYELQEAVRDRRLGEFLAANGVSYLVIECWDRPHPDFEERMYEHRFSPGLFEGDYTEYSFRIPSYVYGGVSEPIVLHRAQEVYRDEVPFQIGPSLFARMIVFELRSGS